MKERRALAAQQRLWRRNERWIRTRIAPDDRHLAAYRRRAGWPRRRPEPVAEELLWRRLAAAPIAVVGDHFFTAFGKEVALALLQRHRRAGRRPALIIAALTPREVALFRQAEGGERLEKALARSGRWGRHLPLAGYRDLFRSLARWRIPVYGADGGSGDLLAKDENVLRLVRRLSGKKGAPPLVLLAGELRASPGALPRRLRRAGFGGAVSLAVNPPRHYFDILARGRRPRALRLSESDYAYWNASPLVSQQRLIDWAYGEEAWFDPRQSERAVRATLRRICAWFGVPRPRRQPRLSCCADEGYAAALARARLSRTAREYAWRQVESGESWTIPGFDHLYLATSSYTHLGEELAHWLRLHFVPEREARSLFDLFCRTVAHETLGFIGSRIAGSARAAPAAREVAQALGGAAPRASSLPGGLLSLRLARRLRRWSPRRFQKAAHVAGYALGEDLFRRLAGAARKRRRALLLAQGAEFFLEAARR